MSSQTYDPEDDEQSLALLRALGDEFSQQVLRLLMAERLTQTQLAERLQMKQSTLSRRLSPLKLLGVLQGGAARRAVYRVEFRDEIYEVLGAANALAEAINDRRNEAQRRASRQVRKERLQGQDAPEA